MDQGVIESDKRRYRNLYLYQCLVVTENEMDEPGHVDTRRKRTSYYHMTDEEIAEYVQRGEGEDVEEEVGEEGSAAPGPSLATGLEAADTLLNLIDKTGAPIFPVTIQ
ncbi:hypothetical protein Pcinc_003235 [Petrolisthes cinctipes]|uniref:Uncharacterized protein n=1 Tax=Petrolisthes cinctipes TaxID=88211 RepID=A0AAE1L1I3_PETCI|nr:hypothetical protein Pcinc_003235 [Petrolisthes cinctipes]